MPEKNREIRLLIVDSRRGRWLRASHDARGRTRIVEEERFELDFAESEHGRPSALSSQRGAYVHAGIHKEDAEKDSAFARQVVAFLQAKVTKDPGVSVALFAPARFIGALRKNVPAQLRAHLHEHEGELVNFDASRLAAHPEIAKLLA